jgi:hypothetical protein
VLERFGETHATAKQENLSGAKARKQHGTETAASDTLAINSIAAKLDVKSGSDLVLAACFAITRSNVTSCSRTEILAEMRRATSYYKTSDKNNLSKYIKTLLKDKKILEQSSGSYALSAATRTDLEAKVA